MPTGKHEERLPLTIEEVWDFVKEMNNWAPLVPGYIDHEILNEKQSTWEFNGDLGVVKKNIKLRIDIKEWKEPTKVAFDLTGINEKFHGEGYFLAEMINDKETKMIGFLDITAKGVMAPLVNPVLKSFVPKTAKELTKAIAEKLVEVKSST